MHYIYHLQQRRLDMAGLIMLGLIVFSVLTLAVMLATRQGKKRILKALAVFLVIIGVFFLYAEKTCGPDSADVKAMKPQGEVITNYILQNGIPESMSDIPNLLYKLEGCERKLMYKKYRKVGYIEEYFEEESIDGAKGEVLEEKCLFKQKGKNFDVYIRFSVKYKDDFIVENNISNINIYDNNIIRIGYGKLSLFSKESETGISYNYKFDSNGQIWVYEYFGIKERINPKIFSRKNDGLCNPMRQ
jgi:hypothetical protein